MLDLRTIKVKVGIPDSFKVGWYLHKITGSNQLNSSVRWHMSGAASEPGLSFLKKKLIQQLRALRILRGA